MGRFDDVMIRILCIRFQDLGMGECSRLTFIHKERIFIVFQYIFIVI